MMSTTGTFLINSHIPEKYRIPIGASIKDIEKIFSKWAKEDPKTYSKNISEIKKIADQIATFEGLSIGLDDITPMIKERDSFLAPFITKFDKATTDQAKKEIVTQAMQEGSKMALSQGKGSLVDMIHTKTKGNASQLMKTIFSPISAREYDNTPYPFITKKSFAEGLTPGEYWVDSIEARNATVSGKTQVALPGDLGKQLFNSLNNLVITTKDCGTKNGIILKTNDNNIIDRYVAKDIPGVIKRNTLIDSKMDSILQRGKIKEVVVRSPMTCEARNGVCQMCYGLNSTGKHHDIGQNVGTIAAQSLAEPLTQMALSTKHGVMLAGRKVEDVGIEGIKKLLAKPEIFPNKATLAQTAGIVEKIMQAPQGGHYVYVHGIEHYVPLTNKIIISKSQHVSAGDHLSDGMADPRELTNLKGLGSGREYFVNAMYDAYNPIDHKTGERSGIALDKRHIEILAKKDFNHVVIDSHNDTFSRGDVVDYNRLKSYMQENIKKVSLKDALGEHLGNEYFHFTVGTQITPEIVNFLKSHGVSSVIISKNNIKFSPYVTNIRRVPLLKKDFFSKMTHHEIKNTLMEAAQLGEKSDIHTYDPVPPFIRGVTFGEGPDGQY